MEATGGRTSGPAPRDPPRRAAHRRGVRAPRRGRALILDTNALSALAGGDEELAEAVGAAEIAVPVIVLGEYRYGIASSRHAQRYDAWLRALLAVVPTLRIDEDTAAHYAAIRHGLRLRGHPIPSNDTWIAALALQHRLPVLSRDAHFDEVAGVKRITW